MGLLRRSYRFRTTKDPPNPAPEKNDDQHKMLMQWKDLVDRFQEDDSDADHKWKESADNQLEFNTFVW